jgi:hypothetical protein
MAISSGCTLFTVPRFTYRVEVFVGIFVLNIEAEAPNAAFARESARSLTAANRHKITLKVKAPFEPAGSFIAPTPVIGKATRVLRVSLDVVQTPREARRRLSKDQ